MKKTLLSLTLTGALAINIQAQNVEIPDANFKAYLLANTQINTNADSEIHVNEAANATSINCPNLGITDLTGIEYFTNIVQLRCEENAIPTLDLTSNTNLQGSLYVTGNGMTSLTLPPNSGIDQLWASSNQFVTIDLTGQTSLEMIRLINNYYLTSLDLSTNSGLTQLFLNSTANLTELDISSNQNLTGVYAGYSGLTSLDISNNPSIYYVSVNQNENLASLNMANGNNMSFGPGNFTANDCPSLTCVEVDNVSFSNQVWSGDVDSGVSFSLDCTTSSGVLISTISIQGEGGATSTSLSTPIQMEANILPANATNQSVTWTVQDGTGSASIDVNGLLTGVTTGDVLVGAMAIDGSGAYAVKSMNITPATSISDESMDKIVHLFPNPVKNNLAIQTDENILSIQIFNQFGSLVQVENSKNFSVEKLTNGMYLIRVNTENGSTSQKFVKE